MKKLNKKILKLFILSPIMFIICIGILNNKMQLTYALPQSNHIDMHIIPLEKTFTNLGYTIISKTDNFIILKNDIQEINFVYEPNFKLKKNDNTYYMFKHENINFIRNSVLLDLGYELFEENNQTYIIYNGENIKLDTDFVFTILNNIYSSTSVTNKTPTFYGLDIVNRNINIKDVEDYEIETINLMNYSIDDLETFLLSNYNKTIKEYKEENLVKFTDKYKNVSITSYQLLSNGQILIVFIDENNSHLIEVVLSIQNGEFYVEI